MCQCCLFFDFNFSCFLFPFPLRRRENRTPRPPLRNVMVRPKWGFLGFHFQANSNDVSCGRWKRDTRKLVFVKFILSYTNLDCSQPLPWFFNARERKSKQSEREACGGRSPTLSSLPFCARVKFSRESIRAFKDEIKYEKIEWRVASRQSELGLE